MINQPDPQLSLSRHEDFWRYGIVFALVATGVATSLLPAGNLAHALAFATIYLWPLITWTPRLRGNLYERLLGAAALALLGQSLLNLLLTYWPGALPTVVWIAGAVIWAALPLVTGGWRLQRPVLPAPTARRRWLAVVSILLLAAFFRFNDLGYKEIQGDEGIALVRAASALQGDDGALFKHQKGPLEITLPLGAWGGVGQIDDFWARLPFAWAGWLAVAAVMAVARRRVGPEAAMAAGMLLAINGFAIAFSRIMQYQSLVMLFGAMALLQADVYRQGRRRTSLWWSALFLAGGLLAHYDAVLLVPALVWLLWPVWREPGRVFRAWAGAVALGGLTLVLFYVPFALQPGFQGTLDYLLRDRLGGGDAGRLVGWGGPRVWQMLTFYNSTYYIAGLILFVLIGLWVAARRRRFGPIVAWFLAPALFYLLLVADPRTHVYTLFPGAVVLAGIGVRATAARLNRSGFRRLAATLLFAWLLLSAGYVYLLFVDHSPERQRTWADNRPALYPVSWTEPPLFGLFGFPYQAGWRVASDLLPAGGAPYGSNEEEEITNWYMAQAPRTHCPNFDLFFLAQNVQDEVPVPSEWLADFLPYYEITVNGSVRMSLLRRGYDGPVQTVPADAARRWLTPAQIAPPRFVGTHPVAITLGDQQVRLLGYDISEERARPGESVMVTLYWEALAPFAANHQSFVHFFDGSMIAQHDGAPECGINPTSRWETGQIIPDAHVLTVPTSAPAGPVPILVGMYDLLSETRLTVPNSPDNVIHLGDIIIE